MAKLKLNFAPGATGICAGVVTTINTRRNGTRRYLNTPVSALWRRIYAGVVTTIDTRRNWNIRWCCVSTQGGKSV